jgi:hypothetical protein
MAGWTKAIFGDFGGTYATSLFSTCLNNAIYNAEFGLTLDPDLLI